MDWKALGNKAAQFAGLLLYGAAFAVANGDVALPAAYAPFVAIFGGALRSFSDSNALTPPAAKS